MSMSDAGSQSLTDAGDGGGISAEDGGGTDSGTLGDAGSTSTSDGGNESGMDAGDGGMSTEGVSDGGTSHDAGIDAGIGGMSGEDGGVDGGSGSDGGSSDGGAVLCASSADCPAGDRCVDAVCTSTACGSNTDCPSGDQCVAGACAPATPPSSVQSCLIVPASAVAVAGGTEHFSVAAFGAANAAISYDGAVTWSSSLAGVTAQGSGTAATFSIPQNVSGGTGFISATIGTVTCTSAQVQIIGSASTGTLRVTVVDGLSGTPVTSATIIDGAGTALTSNGDGTYSEPNPHPAGKNSVSVYASGYTYTTFIDTSATDLYVPVRSAADQTPAQFSGTMDSSAFTNLVSATGTAHFAEFGASVAGNVMDSALDGLLPGSVPVSVTLGGPSSTTVNMPVNTVEGLGQTMFKSSFSFAASPGYRVLWTLGGNTQVSNVLGLLSGGGTVNLESLDPFFQGLESGIAAVRVTPNETGQVITAGAASSSEVLLVPQIQASLSVDTVMPSLPTFYLPTDTAGAPSGQFQTATLIGGALVPQQGFIPLGFITGSPDPTNMQRVNDGFDPSGMMSLQLAPKSGGIEQAPDILLALATSGSSGAAVTGSILLPGEITNNGGNATQASFLGEGAGQFLGLPEQPVVGQQSRTLTLGTDAAGAVMHRLDLGSGPSTWEIYFPANETSVAIPVPPGNKDDYFNDLAAASSPSVVLYSFTLGLNGDGSNATYTYDDVLASGGPHVNDLSLQIDQFSYESLALQ
jgi:hypothetical protein